MYYVQDGKLYRIITQKDVDGNNVNISQQVMGTPAQIQYSIDRLNVTLADLQAQLDAFNNSQTLETAKEQINETN